MTNKNTSDKDMQNMIKALEELDNSRHVTWEQLNTPCNAPLVLERQAYLRRLKEEPEKVLEEFAEAYKRRLKEQE